MEVSYEIIRSARKTMSLQITPQGKVLVRCPRRLPKREIEAFVREKSRWLETHLNKIAQRPQLPALSETDKRCLKLQAREVIPQRLAYFAPLVGVAYGQVALRMQKTRWGSCSRQGNLNFNILLMLTPPEVIDYVVVHELCHRLEMNHSPAFWAQVERVLPDYRLRKKWLKDQGGSIMARAFPEDRE